MGRACTSRAVPASTCGSARTVSVQALLQRARPVAWTGRYFGEGVREGILDLVEMESHAIFSFDDRPASNRRSDAAMLGVGIGPSPSRAIVEHRGLAGQRRPDRADH